MKQTNKNNTFGINFYTYICTDILQFQIKNQNKNINYLELRSKNSANTMEHFQFQTTLLSFFCFCFRVTPLRFLSETFARFLYFIRILALHADTLAGDGSVPTLTEIPRSGLRLHKECVCYYSNMLKEKKLNNSLVKKIISHSRSTRNSEK